MHSRYGYMGLKGRIIAIRLMVSAQTIICKEWRDSGDHLQDVTYLKLTLKKICGNRAAKMNGGTTVSA